MDISRSEKTPDIFRRVSRTCGGRANIDKSITGSINTLAVQPGRESMAEEARRPSAGRKDAC